MLYASQRESFQSMLIHVSRTLDHDFGRPAPETLNRTNLGKEATRLLAFLLQ